MSGKAVIVEPEIAENTGFIARLAANFNFDLRIVNPDFNLSEARKTASKAQQKLREAEIYDDVAEPVEDLDFVVGTKPGRGQPLGEFEPRNNSSVMIGRESSGLKSSELELCDAVVHIQTGDYSSINQSHAAAILFHEFSSQTSEKSGISTGQKKVLKKKLSPKVFNAVMRSNPDRDEVDAMIGELKDRNRD